MDRLYLLTVTIPANTQQVTPFSQSWPLEDAELVYVDINVPPGASGLMGFRILWASQQVIPWGNNSYLITDNEKIHVDCNFMMTNTGLVVQGYNTDIFPHVIYVRGLIRDYAQAEQADIASTSNSLALPASPDAGLINGGIDTLTAASAGLTDQSVSASQPAQIPDLASQQVTDITGSSDMGVVQATVTDTSPPSTGSAPVTQPPSPVSTSLVPKPVIKPPVRIKPVPPVIHRRKIKISSRHTLTRS